MKMMMAGTISTLKTWSWRRSSALSSRLSKSSSLNSAINQSRGVSLLTKVTSLNNALMRSAACLISQIWPVGASHSLCPASKERSKSFAHRSQRTKISYRWMKWKTSFMISNGSLPVCNWACVTRKSFIKTDLSLLRKLDPQPRGTNATLSETKKSLSWWRTRSRIRGHTWMLFKLISNFKT